MPTLARLCTNAAGVHHLNSVHGLYLDDEHRALGRDLLSLASLNSVTLLGAELVGRSYGGGVLKLEPREADRWPMPSPALVSERSSALRSIRRRVRDLLTAGRVFDASEVVDGALWSAPLHDLAAIRVGRAHLHERRVSAPLHVVPGDADEALLPSAGLRSTIFPSRSLRERRSSPRARPQHGS